MGHHSEAFIGIDTSKLRNAVAVAEAGHKGEVRYLGEFDTSTAATRKLVAKLAAQYGRLTFCHIRCRCDDREPKRFRCQVSAAMRTRSQTTFRRNDLK